MNISDKKKDLSDKKEDSGEKEKFEVLLEYLNQSRGFDFTGYRRPSLMRRIGNRMHLVGLNDFDDYMDYLQVHPEEFSNLFNAILINVTSFLRDPPAWNYLANEIIPKIIKAKKENDPIRVWSAGCSSGEEPYTLAMMLAEALGDEAFHNRVKIYATDVDEVALSEARQASYTKERIQPIPAHLLEKYFELVGKRYIFRTDLRRSMIFGRHDLFKDAPISRLDLLVCRNTLMYFNSDTQAVILNRFHFALKNAGFLFLGKSELLITHSNLFIPVDIKHRIFSKVVRVRPRNHLPDPAQLHDQGARPEWITLKDASLENLPMAHLLLNKQGALILANERARILFGLGAKDIGRLVQDLEVSYKPLELRSQIEKAYIERRNISVSKVERHLLDGKIQYLDVEIAPLQEDGIIIGASVTFFDVTHYQNLGQDLERSRQELETAHEELQSTVEELETTNEELQSSNEELETTNEELQSTNEEIETMNEELQSTNEELQTINDELRQRTEELNRANSFLQSILTGMHSGLIVVDGNFQVISWNRKSRDLWGLSEEDVKMRPFFGLDIGLRAEEFADAIRACLGGETDYLEKELDAINLRGKPIRVRITLTPLKDLTGKRDGVIILVDELGK
jgi:two-component system, chemotaxis family, CheB/CheR fusion protein